jgi:hypothetical protein
MVVCESVLYLIYVTFPFVKLIRVILYFFSSVSMTGRGRDTHGKKPTKNQ